MWRRAPRLRREFAVTTRQTNVTNAYGGSIALVVPADYEGGRVPVTVRGAIPMAVYTDGESDATTWFADLDAGAPQAIIQKPGGIRLVISAENARGVDDPGEVLGVLGRVLSQSRRTLGRARAEGVREQLDLRSAGRVGIRQRRAGQDQLSASRGTLGAPGGDGGGPRIHSQAARSRPAAAQSPPGPQDIPRASTAWTGGFSATSSDTSGKPRTGTDATSARSQ